MYLAESERRVRQQVQAYQPMWTSARPRRTNEEPASPRGLRSNAQKGRQKRKRAPRPSHRSRAVLLSRQVGTAPPSSETDSEDNVPLAKKLGIKFPSLQSRHSPPSGQDIDEGDCSDDNIPLAQLVGRRTGLGDVALKEVDQSKQADKGAIANHQLPPCTLRGSDVADGVKVDQGGALTIENKKDGPSVQEDAASPHLVHLPPGSHLSSLVELGQGNRVIADSDQRGTEGLHAIATGMAGILDNKVLPDGEVSSHEGTDIMAAGVSGTGEGNTMDGRLQSSQRAEGVHASSHNAPQAGGIDLACHLGQDVGRDQGPDLGHPDKSVAQPDICQGADTDPEACAADVSMLSVQATQQAHMGGGENGDAAPPSQGEPPESVSAGVPQFYEVVPDSYEDDGL
ncbi:unnamed protein product [Ostreobium quekettii]|uniref:Uncharacterized protein n=1 Tax=Ostreobium quekettii TaxID=121088 RepID=A0A8S1IKB6_9CHLO|nr:unnamed protein product [Ostreobium quekettii]